VSCALEWFGFEPLIILLQAQIRLWMLRSGARHQPLPAGAPPLLGLLRQG